MHSSRVGTTIRARAARRSAARSVSTVMRLSRGTPKAKVLPCRCGPGRSDRRKPSPAAGSVPGSRRRVRCRGRPVPDDLVADAELGEGVFGMESRCVSYCAYSLSVSARCSRCRCRLSRSRIAFVHAHEFGETVSDLRSKLVAGSSRRSGRGGGPMSCTHISRWPNRHLRP